MEVGDWDAGLRLSDRVANHLLAVGEGARFKFLAARLSDGGGDDTLYDSKAQAVAAQLAPQHCAFVRITPDGMAPVEAYRYLVMARQILRHGARLDDPEHTPILPTRREEVHALWT